MKTDVVSLAQEFLNPWYICAAFAIIIVWLAWLSIAVFLRDDDQRELRKEFDEFKAQRKAS
jgi:hypothetical protein